MAIHRRMDLDDMYYELEENISKQEELIAQEERKKVDGGELMPENELKLLKKQVRRGKLRLRLYSLQMFFYDIYLRMLISYRMFLTYF